MRQQHSHFSKSSSFFSFFLTGFIGVSFLCAQTDSPKVSVSLHSAPSSASQSSNTPLHSATSSVAVSDTSVPFDSTFKKSFSLGNADGEVFQTLQHILHERYREASNAAQKIGNHNAGVGCVLEGMVRIGRYDGLGDLKALKAASDTLNKCRAKGYWEALRIFELGYAQNEMGHAFKGAMNTRTAAKVFEKSDDLDARAFYAIYAYYMDETFSWLPFVSDNRPAHLQILAEGASKSKRFRPLFTTSLIWMLYDRGEFKEALRYADNILAEVPGHPVFLQIRADMLYRLKRYDEAAAIYEQSAADYLKRTGSSIRYWSAVANLIRIYNDSGNAERKMYWQKIIRSEEFEKIRPNMPGSLMSDLEKRKLL